MTVCVGREGDYTLGLIRDRFSGALAVKGTSKVSGRPVRQFASDNRSGICPEAWEALEFANRGHAGSYGDDDWTRRVERLMRQIFQTDCEVYLTATGTAANSLATAALCQSYHSVICDGESHMATDECGAPGYFAHGVTLVAGEGKDGKLTPEIIEHLATRRRDIHSSKPRAVSLTQATEMGTLYSPPELRRICATARRLGLAVHMDGARFANAVAALKCSPAEISCKAGVDVLCFGGTKNGMSCGEAVIFFPRGKGGRGEGGAEKDFAYRRKQAGQLLSKMRFVAAQWVGVLEGDAWLKHAAHSNAMAKKLEQRLKKLGAQILFPVQANAVFVRMTPAVQKKLQARGWEFYTFVTEDCVRFMCSWDTREEDIERLAEDLRGMTNDKR